jgi:GH35 family endo-1,4-beta-xylanase
VFRVVDQNKEPVVGVDVRVAMTAHEFRFGMQSLQSTAFNSPETKARYDNWIRRTLNQATLHTCWRWIEPYPQDYRFGNLEQNILDADKYGAKKLAHCLYWDHYDWFKPSWIPSHFDFNSYMRLWQQYIDAIAEKYSDKIDAWHVINEATLKEDGRITDRIIVPDGFYKAFDYVRQKLKGEYGACFYQDVFQTIFEKNNLSPEYIIARDIITRGMPVDFISLQFHVFDNRWLLEAYHPGSIRRTIEKFGSLGVPVEIAELGVYFGIDLNHPELRNATHDPAAQAALIKNMYKFFFSLPEIRAVTYWHEFGRNAWFVNMIVDENWNLLQSGEEITNLIMNEWKTNITGKTDSHGVFAARCFFGDYKIEIQTKNGLFVYNADCRKHSAREHTFILL